MWATPNATWRASSRAASRVTSAVTGSGACSWRNRSRSRNVPSPRTDSRNDAEVKSGSSSRVCSEARPPAPDTPSGRHTEGPAGEDLDVARLVGGLHRQQLHDLAKMRVNPGQESRRDDQGGLLVLDEVGHELHHGMFDIGGHTSAGVPVDRGRRIPLARGRAAYSRGASRPRRGRGRSSRRRRADRRPRPGPRGPPAPTRVGALAGTVAPRRPARVRQRLGGRPLTHSTGNSTPTSSRPGRRSNHGPRPGTRRRAAAAAPDVPVTSARCPGEGRAARGHSRCPPVSRPRSSRSIVASTDLPGVVEADLVDAASSAHSRSRPRAPSRQPFQVEQRTQSSSA